MVPVNSPSQDHFRGPGESLDTFASRLQKIVVKTSVEYETVRLQVRKDAVEMGKMDSEILKLKMKIEEQEEKVEAWKVQFSTLQEAYADLHSKNTKMKDKKENKESLPNTSRSSSSDSDLPIAKSEIEHILEELAQFEACEVSETSSEIVSFV